MYSYSRVNYYVSEPAFLVDSLAFLVELIPIIDSSDAMYEQLCVLWNVCGIANTLMLIYRT